MRGFSFLIFVTLLIGKDPVKLDHFVDGYFLLAKSRMESSPTVWQDIREGYYRSYGIYFASLVLDSLALNEITPYEACIRHFQTMDDIREEVISGKEFSYKIDPPLIPNFSVNYFSSNKD